MASEVLVAEALIIAFLPDVFYPQDTPQLAVGFFTRDGTRAQKDLQMMLMIGEICSMMCSFIPRSGSIRGHI